MRQSQGRSLHYDYYSCPIKRYTYNFQMKRQESETGCCLVGKMLSRKTIRLLAMTDHHTPQESVDSKADALAAVAILLIVVTAVVYWLSRF